jgi:hypothetical protein
MGDDETLLDHLADFVPFHAPLVQTFLQEIVLRTNPSHHVITGMVYSMTLDRYLPFEQTIMAFVGVPRRAWLCVR